MTSYLIVFVVKNKLLCIMWGKVQLDKAYISMFRGIYEISLDTKGRLSVPAKVRAILQEQPQRQLVLTADLDRNLLIYPLGEWEMAETKLVKLSSTDRRARLIKQLYLAYACECELDSTGRILIPPMLRKFAGLEKKVVLSGMGNKLELWDRSRWNDMHDQGIEALLDEGFDLGEELGSLSI